MLILRKIAVTGGIAAGKSTVCQMLRSHGAYVVDADKIVHRLLSLDTEVGQQIVKLLGPSIITDQQIDRKKIAKLVFSNPEKLLALETILHPAVKTEIDREYNSVKAGNYRFFVAEVPLLFEAGFDLDFDVTIAVVAKTEIAKKRFGKGYDLRMKRQLSQEQKQKKADFTIINEGDLGNLKSQVDLIATQI
jgi:dephospho-CoA kinase